jgi:hypothetical protein
MPIDQAPCDYVMQSAYCDYPRCECFSFFCDISVVGPKEITAALLESEFYGKYLTRGNNACAARISHS